MFRRSAGFRGAVTHAGVGLGGTTFLGPARVSRRDEGWNLLAPGWRVMVDPDNASVGNLLWVGHPGLVDTPEAASDTPTAIVEAPTQDHPLAVPIRAELSSARIKMLTRGAESFRRINVLTRGPWSSVRTQWVVRRRR